MSLIDPEPPSDKKTEAAFAFAKGLVSSIPIAGGVISEVGALFFNPQERRRSAWIKSVAAAVSEIEKKLGRLPEDLQSDERFVSGLYQATYIALRNHREEKLKFLKNALVSIGAVDCENEDEEAHFIRLVDELTVSHVLILQTFRMHTGGYGAFGEEVDIFSMAIEFSARTGIQVEPDLFRTFLRDLDAKSLVHASGVKDLKKYAADDSTAVMEGATERPFTITETGQRFLRFVDEYPTSEAD